MADHRVHRRTVCAGLLAATSAAWAADWKPGGQVEYVIPAAAGGAVDTYGRVMKKVFDSSGALGGQSFIISNRPGGQGMIAVAPVVQRTGDATVFTMLSTGYMLGQVLGEFKHDLQKDFTIGPIFFEEALVVAVRADSPLKSGRDLVEHLKQDPASLRIAVAPTLNNHIHIGILKPLKVAGVDTGRLTVAPFRSSAESVTALRGGHVDVVSSSSTNVVTGVQSGALRVLAVSSRERLPGALAQVPTWREQGVDSVFTSVQGVLFPRGISAEQIAFWDRRMRELSNAPEWKAALQQYEVTPRFMDHTQAAAYVAEELQSSARLLRQLGMVR
ncbi:tripartite tricarboxylate transporter substrate binding protein [uncultured Xylophilus sp.]|uniref:Bug family tripartite tricarboxylate transporter substrate binding protein n=1 Tax=uncultured Xylophilus sp. TaxID=296832 RepID=UPI0025FE597C|nr:tripartite tricarboxylate transporter substrate binding protein [uncultured Xylophilus sp.]